MGNEITFLSFINKFIDLSQEEYDKLVAPYTETRHFGRKEIVTPAGEVEEYFNFILKGLARKYYYKKGKEEINAQISYEGQILHSQESFHSRMPSEYSIETIEPCVFLSISYSNLQKIYASSYKMERMGRLIITSAFVLKDKWQMHLVKHTARERFLVFVSKNPELMQRVPQKHLASYLNIQQETFSRFKHLARLQKYN